MHLTARVEKMFVALVFALLMANASAARVGDSFRTLRGDDVPRGSWHAMTLTHTGRLIAVGNGANLMLSDDGGTSWEFRRVSVNGSFERIELTDVVEFGHNSGMSGYRLAAIGVWLESDISANWPFAGRTHLYLSDDDGETWSKQPFPEVTAIHPHFGPFDGVALQRLFATEDGRLLAYGTTMVSNLVVTWRVGGLIYRSFDGENWDRSTFELGPIEELAHSPSIGRLVAAGYSTMIDSADGAGWNGYAMEDANVSTPQGPLSPATLEKLAIEDILIHDDHYVATALTHVPYDAGSGTSIPDKLYNLDSDAPFSGARLWQGREQPGRLGKLVSNGTTLAKLGSLGAFTSSNHGQSWSQVTNSPIAVGRAFTRTASGEYLSIGQSSTGNSGMAVWKSSSNLGSWSKVFDRPALPTFWRPLGTSGGRAFACGTQGSSGSINALHASDDNGDTWRVMAQPISCFGRRMVKHGDRLLIPNNNYGVIISDDNGDTWREQTVFGGTRGGATVLTRTAGGRLILGAKGTWLGSTKSHVYVSDDGGDTWASRDLELQWNEPMIDMLAVGNHRVIILSQFNPPFSPHLWISDDDGDSWRLDESLQQIPELPQAGGALIELQQIVRSPTGRILIRGTDAALSSDDNGTTWQYRIGAFDTNGKRAGPWWGDTYDMVHANQRWLMPMRLSNASGEFTDHKLNWMLISDDDGTSWMRREIPSNFDSIVNTLKIGARVLVFGVRGAIWATDGNEDHAPAVPRVLVRAGDTARIGVPRPPIGGDLEMVYATTADPQAVGNEVPVLGTHYDAVAGSLFWSDGDNSPREVEIPTHNTFVATDQPMRRLLLRLATDGADMESVIEIPVSIMNAGSASGFPKPQLLEMDQLELSIGGAAKSFRIALAHKPNADYLAFDLSTAQPAMATVSPLRVSFDQSNWHVPQTIHVTPVDGSAQHQPRLGSAHEILLTSDSDNSSYLNLNTNALYWYPSPLIFADGAED